MNSETHSRFSTAPWYELAQQTLCVVGGAGSIGSWVTALLSRTGMQCVVVDFDLLETHNLGGQLYMAKDVGSPKVEALDNILQELCPDSEPFMIQGTWSESKNVIASETAAMSGHPVIWVAGFDNITARKEMFETFKEQGKPTDLYIDGRMGFDFYEMLICPYGESHFKEYEKTLFEEGESHKAPCTLKSTSFVAAHLASSITAMAVNHLTNLALKEPNARPMPKHIVQMLAWMTQINK